jgi:hypothetical protein
MTLYRAIYQLKASGRVRGMTFAAADATAAAKMAEDWQLPSDQLLTVMPVRPLTVQLELVAG